MNYWWPDTVQFNGVHVSISISSLANTTGSLKCFPLSSQTQLPEASVGQGAFSTVTVGAFSLDIHNVNARIKSTHP